MKVHYKAFGRHTVALSFECFKHLHKERRGYLGAPVPTTTDLRDVTCPDCWAGILAIAPHDAITAHLAAIAAPPDPSPGEPAVVARPAARIEPVPRAGLTPLPPASTHTFASCNALCDGLATCADPAACHQVITSTDPDHGPSRLCWLPAGHEVHQ